MKHRIHRGKRQRIRADEVNRWNRMVQLQQTNALKQSLPTPQNYDRSSRVIVVKNTSGTDRQIYEVGKLGPLLWDLETDGTSGVCWEIATATTTDTPVILLEPIADGGFGRAIVDGLALALVSGGTGDFAEVDVANNRLKPAVSGSIKLLQSPHASALRLLPVILGAGGIGGNAHYLFTLTGTISSGIGTATIRNLDDSADIATGVSLKDPLGHFDGLTSGYRGFCFSAGGIYYALGPYVTKVRWDDPDLEYSRGYAAAWLPIDTAEAC